MNKEELKQLIFENFNSNDLYSLSQELQIIESAKVSAKPTLEELLVECKSKYKIGSYVLIQNQESNVDESVTTVFNRNYKKCKLYIYIKDIFIENFRIILFFDYVEYSEIKEAYLPLNKEDTTWYVDTYTNELTFNKGLGKFIMADVNERKLYNFQYSEITKEEYESKVEIVNNVLKIKI